MMLFFRTARFYAKFHLVGSLILFVVMLFINLNKLKTSR